ncbi:hypothetical protein Dda_3649 [Drechslerella dactyloides]|uniref:Uncharacterized protein n=1 Tax=Drechslerella dactyloides TaxID=74499 RepID=A0AAD6IYB1_DREDA|nr:hypothetical protein Dda_3649 [Drechslerella dactyloides]
MPLFTTVSISRVFISAIMVWYTVRTLPHDDTAHEDLDGPDPLNGHLALTRRLVQAELVPQLVLADGLVVVNLVAEDEEGHLGQLLHGQEGVELGFGFGHALEVLGVDEEDDAGDLGEVVLPEAAGCTSKHQRRLAGIVEPEEKQLGMLVEQAEGGEDVPDYSCKEKVGQHAIEYSKHRIMRTAAGSRQEARYIHQLTMNIAAVDGYGWKVTVAVMSEIGSTR